MGPRGGKRAATSDGGSSAESTPRKPKTQRTSAASKPKTSKTIETFFKNPPPVSLSQIKRPAESLSTQQEDIIEDIEDDDHGSSGHNPQATHRKRSWNVANGKDAGVTSSKFVKLSVEAVSETYIPEESWTEQYSPRDLSELAVHHKKVTDVRKWLEGVFKKQLYQRLLVLRGAAGTGKTSTMALLARELGCELVKWEAPDVAAYGSGQYESAAVKFAEFLSRASSFSGLELVSTDREQPSQPAPKPFQRQLLLVEDFPTMVGSSMAPTLIRFREQLLQYLAASLLARAKLAEDEQYSPVPLILVISESILSSTSPADNFTAHRLLGADILQHPGVSVIDFNPVAPTIISKALKLIVQKHTRHCGRVQKITPELIKSLSEVGDIRNAVSTLEYISKDPTFTARTTPSSNHSSKASARMAKVSGREEGVSSMIALREGTIGLFHAIGKVLYNKRTAEGPGPRPPPDLDVEALVSTSGSDASTLLSALHENYALSCFDQYGDNEVTMETMNGCLDAFSDADMLCTLNGSRRFGAGAAISNSAIEGLRQEDLALHVGVLGTQAALPYPVKRQAIGSAKQSKERGDQFRMFYPTDLKLRRQREDVEFNLGNIATQVLSGRFLNGVPPVRHGRIISQPGRLTGSGPQPMPADNPTVDASADATQGLNIGSGQSAKQMLLLERLPYIIQIYGPKGSELSGGAAHAIQQTEALVKFRGIQTGDEDEGDEEENPQRFYQGFQGSKKGDGEEAAEEAEALQKLVLDADPIVDDFDD